jgi:hypothetical protein
MQQRHLLMGLEGLLLEYLRFGAAGAKCWVGDREIDASRELIPKVETDHTSTLALTLNSCTIILDPGLYTGPTSCSTMQTWTLSLQPSL